MAAEKALADTGRIDAKQIASACDLLKEALALLDGVHASVEIRARLSEVVDAVEKSSA